MGGDDITFLFGGLFIDNLLEVLGLEGSNEGKFVKEWSEVEKEDFDFSLNFMECVLGKNGDVESSDEMNVGCLMFGPGESQGAVKQNFRRKELEMVKLIK